MFNNFMIPLYYGTIGEATKAKMAKWENSRTFAMVFTRLVNMALDYRYGLEGLPDTMDDRIIKQSLLFYGNVTLFNYEGVPIGLPSVPDGQAIDIYGNCKNSFVFSRNGKVNITVPLTYKYSASSLDDGKNVLGVASKSKTASDGVIIWENKCRVPFLWTTLYFAERITDTLRTLDMDRRWLKRPFIPRCEESEGASFDESLKKFMNNEDFSVSLKSRNLDKTDIFTVDLSPELITHVTQLVEWYESQYKTLCGVDSNSQVDKKGENLISDEINIDNMFTDLNSNSIIDDINEQLEIYNKLTGLNIKAVANKTKQEQEKEQKNEEKDLFTDSGRYTRPISERD